MSEKETIERVRAVEDAVTYPILTKEINGTPSGNGSPGAPPPSPGGQSLDAVAQNTIRQALGWRFRTDDRKGFMAALRKTFTLKDVKGHTEWDYQPQSFTVQADMGEITGAQASIYARARNALEQTMPLLNGLTPLKPNPIYEDIEAMRSIIRDEMTQLVGEFAQIAGPRVQRVDNLFKLLLGPKPDYRDPIKAKGHLGQLGWRLGMDRRLVNSIEDEQDLTNFLILVDYINSLYTTWMAQRDFFSRGRHGEPFLGTQLVLLSQALASVGELVQDAFDALDSVFVGPGERQSLFLQYYGEFAPITLEELLGWIKDFSANDGPQLLQEAGKDGVVAFRSTMNRMRYLMFLTVELSRAERRDLGNGFSTYRSQAALQALRDGMGLVDREADKIRRDAFDDDPTLTEEGEVFRIEDPAITPPTAAGDPCSITVGGRNIKPGARMLLISKQHPEKGYEGAAPASTPTLDRGVTPDGNYITAQFNLPGTLQPGSSYTLVVINTTGAYAWLAEAIPGHELQVGAAPTGLTPNIEFATLRRQGNQRFVMRIKGSDFAEDAEVSVTAATALGNTNLIVLTPKWVSAEELTVVIPASKLSGYTQITQVIVTNQSDSTTSTPWTPASILNVP